MGSVRQQRGRLPQRVYWVRRGLVLVIALLLVLGIGKLFGATGSDDPAADVRARTSSAQQAPAASTSIGPVAPSRKLRAKAKVPLLPPNGKCLDDEVSVQPSVERAWAGGPITIKLALRGTAPACTFDVSSASLVVKIVSGKDRIWTSQDCRRAVKRDQVVVRSGQPVVVPVRWSGRRSDEECSNAADWAAKGFYHVFAAAAGSTPNDVQFEVVRGPAVRVTRTPEPRPSASASARPAARTSASPDVRPEQQPSKSASQKP